MASDRFLGDRCRGGGGGAEPEGLFHHRDERARYRPDHVAQLLEVYKAQNVSVERGFRFLKDPMFYAESLYLKLPKRIMALIMVMAISLLVYSLAERKLRKALGAQDRPIGDQTRRPTKSPTIRWVFQKFEDVMILY